MRTIDISHLDPDDREELDRYNQMIAWCSRIGGNDDETLRSLDWQLEKFGLEVVVHKVDEVGIETLYTIEKRK